MQIDVLEMMQNQLKSLGVQMLLLAAPYDNFPEMDFRSLEQNLEHSDYSTLLKMLRESTLPGVVLHFQEFTIQYLFFAFPEYLRLEYGFEYCLIGPVLFQPVTTADFKKFINTYHIIPEQYRNVQEFLNRIPLFPSGDIFFSTVSPYFKMILGEGFHIDMMSDSSAGSMITSPESTCFNHSSDSSLQTLEARYQAETDFLNAVSMGNIEDALHLYHHFTQFRLMPRVADPVRDSKNISFALNTLLRKAVQTSYVHPYHIDNLSTQFAIQIENCTNNNQLRTLSHTMIRKYCMLVKNHSRRGYSSLIQLSLDYIDTHYSDDLSLDSLSKICAVTNSYLSALFKKETGMTITDRINTIRIRQALILLNTTHLSIQDIALKVGFQDANYFTRTFKKYQGQSPKEYRKKIFQ